MRPRHGFTLIELLIVMSVGTSLLVLSVTVVHRCMRIHTEARQQLDVQRTAVRFASQLRRDLHRAEEALLEGDTLALKIVSPAGPINSAYDFSSHTAIRTQSRRDDTLGQADVHRESFDFGSRSRIEAIELTAPRRIAVRVVEQGHTQGMPPRVLLNFESTVGRLAQLVDDRETPE